MNLDNNSIKTIVFSNNENKNEDNNEIENVIFNNNERNNIENFIFDVSFYIISSKKYRDELRKEQIISNEGNSYVIDIIKTCIISIENPHNKMFCKDYVNIFNEFDKLKNIVM